MLTTCLACDGFLPPDALACPHCQAAQPSAGQRRRAGAFATWAAAAGASMTLMACYGAPYDETYQVECLDDTDCAQGYFCDAASSSCQSKPVENCTNGIDDDGDGLVDCAQRSCGCVLEQNCYDGLDNDADGRTDCFDPDCAQFCGAAEICGDGIDNDHDQLTDCADPSCACEPPPETDCGNGLDDDADGAIDCADADCAAAPVCVPPAPTTESACSDGADDDGDGLVDCADQDCAAACSPTCGDGVTAGAEACDDGNDVDADACSNACALDVAQFCAGLTPLAEGANGGTTQTSTNAFQPSCVPGALRERAFSFVAPADGSLYLTLDATLTLGVAVTLGCGPVATEIACAPGSAPSEATTLEVPLPGGAPITVLVDGAAPGASGSFVLLANFVALP